MQLYEAEAKDAEKTNIQPTVEAPEVVKEAAKKAVAKKPRKKAVAKPKKPVQRVLEISDLTPLEVFDIFAELHAIQPLPDVGYEFRASGHALKAGSVAQLMEARQTYLHELEVVRDRQRRRRAAAALVLLAA
jgi:hypothetical protein